MKLAILAFFALAATAQTSRSVTLNWVNAKNPAGTVSNVYKAPSACSANPTNFVRIATGLTANTYLDSPVPIGAYCYYVTAVYAGMESTPSPTANAPVQPFAPEGVTVTVSAVISVTVGPTQATTSAAQAAPAARAEPGTSGPTSINPEGRRPASPGE